MKSQFLPLFFLLAGAYTFAQPADQSLSNAGYIDAVMAAPDHYKLLAENDHVRVIEMFLPAGKRDNLHSHNHETVYFIKGGKAKVYIGDEVAEIELPDEFVMHHAPWTHSVENTGTDPIHAVIFERMQQITVQPMEDYIDVVKASSEYYTLLSHEGDIRVILMNLPAGAEDALHSHYAESVYFLSGGKVIIQTNSKEIEAEIPDGFAMQNDGWTHRVKNTGTTTIKAVIFEQVPSGTGQ